MNNRITGDEDILIARLMEGTLSDDEFLVLMNGSVHDADFIDSLVRSSMLEDLLSQHVESSRSAAHARWLDDYLLSGSCNGWSPAPTILSQESDNSSSNPPAVKALLPPWLSACLSLVLVLGLFAAASFVMNRGNQAGRLNEQLVHAEKEKEPQLVSSVARVSRSINVEWGAESIRWAVGETLQAGDRICISSGRMELVFDSGAVTALAGPASMTIRARDAVQLDSGTVTTRIDNVKTGEFRVFTPNTEVLDMGTEFGVRVDSNGETDVVVFDGEVHLTPVSSSARNLLPHRLTFGEAVRVDSKGDWTRLVSVESNAFPFGDRLFQSKRRSPVIVGVTDNIQQTERSKFYQICHAGLEEDVRAYVDRVHEWNGITEDGIPYFLRGADYVATFCDDKRIPIEVTVELAQPAMLYIFHDSRLPVPRWLSDSFEDTGLRIGLDEGPSPTRDYHLGISSGKSIDTQHMIWQRRVEEPGFIALGRAFDRKRPKGISGTMYGIAAQPLPAEKPTAD